LNEWGLDVPNLDLNELEATEDDFDVDADSIETDIVVGDLFEIGEHRLLCGDSTDSDAVARLMDGQKADMVFTDPPYLMDFTGGIHADGTKSFNSKHGGIKNDKMSKEDGDDFLDAINTNIQLFNKGAFYICFYRLKLGEYFESLKRTGLEVRALITWNKGNHTLSNSDYMSKCEHIFYGWVEEHNFYGGNNGVDIWEIPRTQKNELHPTMKPIALCEKAISDASKTKDKILDLFLGSGSTMVASHQLKRKCYGMELDPKYCQVIIDRMKKLDPTIKIKRNGVEI
jgi:DNA modification methylase